MLPEKTKSAASVIPLPLYKHNSIIQCEAEPVNIEYSSAAIIPNINQNLAKLNFDLSRWHNVGDAALGVPKKHIVGEDIIRR